MAKWSAILVIMMVIVVVAVEANGTKNSWIKCYRKCSKSCADNDGNCFERCKIKCGGPNPPHSSSRIPHGMESVEVGGRRK
ncbi:hypothetical protein ISN44_As02g014740 [Arabidopsis suecica]|uniref:Plant thionin family protein n=1 Tax=Arabidopsis suecica TaxID=45249 RepID=A0A8T2FYK5_ARASU|nr:hypothetical protein ISN44_As02g014740 [Arabidopsis suecica]